MRKRRGEGKRERKGERKKMRKIRRKRKEKMEKAVLKSFSLKHTAPSGYVP